MFIIFRELTSKFQDLPLLIKGQRFFSLDLQYVPKADPGMGIKG